MLLLVLDPLEGGEREPLSGEHHEADPDADRHLDRLEHQPVGEAGAVRHAVLDERQRDGSLQEPDVPRPEGKDGRDVHQQQDEGGGRERDVEAERLGSGPHGEELQRPTDDLEQDRPEGSRGDPQHREPLTCHREQPARRLLPLRALPRSGVRRAESTARVSSPRPTSPTTTTPVTAQCGSFAVEEHVADEERDREQVEQPVGEDGAEQRRAGAAALGQVSPQDGDPCELARPRGEHGVPQQADAEGREHRGEARQRRRHRLVDRHVPGPGPDDHGDEVEQDGDAAPSAS